MKNAVLILMLALAGAIWTNPAGAAIFDPAANNAVNALLVQPDGAILAGGDFTVIGGQNRNHLARLSPIDGSADPAFNPNVDAAVHCVVRQPDGKLLISGAFTAVGASPQGRVARLNADGSVDAGFAADVTGGTTSVLSMALQDDGKIVIVGEFTAVSGVSRARVARLNTDGSLDPSFNPGTGVNSRVYDVALQADGKIVIGGAFTSYNGQSRFVLARLSSTGTLDTTFLPALNNVVRAVIVQPDGKIVATGNFTTANTTAQLRIARLNPDGSLDATPNPAVDAEISATTLLSDGRLLVGGVFDHVLGVVRARAAVLLADGALDESFHDPALNGRVLAFAEQTDAKILVGGTFNQIAGYPRTYIARLNADGSLDISQYIVTPSAGEHGRLSPATPQIVNEGEAISFTIAPDEGYGINSISGCDGSLDGVTYTTAAVLADCTVTVDFVAHAPTFTVTPLAGDHGTLSPDTPQSIGFGQTASFTVTPETGYHIDSVTGCDGSLAGGVYTIAPVMADCTVTASFVTPAAITVVTGSPQVTAVGTPFAVPLAVRVTGADGRPIAAATVDFSAPAGGAGALLSAGTVATDANGEASVSARANNAAGSYAVTATAINGVAATLTLANEAHGSDGIELRVTVSTDPPPACGSASQIDVPAGEPVNFCFTVTNHGPNTLNYHTLTYTPRDNEYTPGAWSTGELFYLKQQPITPGASWQYNQAINAGTTAQTPEFQWTALADLPHYAVETTTDESFVDISASGTPLNLTEYGVYTLELPFPIDYFGIGYLPNGDDKLCVHNSGSLRFARGGCATVSDGIVPPFVGDNAPFQGLFWLAVDGILPYWDLLGDNGQIYVATTGGAPNRELIVQWQDKDHSSRPNSANGITFQARIAEADGAIRFVYSDVDFNTTDSTLDGGGSATIGLAAHIGDLRQQYAYETPVLADGDALIWLPTRVAHVALSGVRLTVGTPRIEVGPAPLSATAAPGGSTALSLDIGNSGNLVLDWTLTAAESTAHFPLTQHRVTPVGDPQASLALPAARSAGSESLPASAVQTPTAVFDVPAYGMKTESRSTTTSMYPVGFDAAHPDYFEHVTPAAYYGGVFGGDFVDDDYGKEYVLDAYFDSDFSLSTLDLTDGVYTPIGRPEPEGADAEPYPRWTGMAWDRTTRLLYASTGGGGQYCESAPKSTLHTIDLASGAAAKVGDIAFDDDAPLCVADIAVAPSGLMYGVDLYNDALLAIDKTSGRATIIGSLGFDLHYVNSIDFDDVTGTLYLAAYQENFSNPDGGVYTVDLVTGTAHRLAPFPLLDDNQGYLYVSALAIARAGGDCAFPGEIPWLSTNLQGGNTAPGASSPVGVTLDAANLGEGVYSANLCVSSNDRAHPLVKVPVEFTVTTRLPDAIFIDGFDGVSP